MWACVIKGFVAKIENANLFLALTKFIIHDVRNKYIINYLVKENDSRKRFLESY